MVAKQTALSTRKSDPVESFIQPMINRDQNNTSDS